MLDDGEKPPVVRVEAISTLRHWIGRGAGQEDRLFDPKTRSGILTEGGKLTPSEAAIFVELLHTPGVEQLDSPAFWAYLIDKLKDDKLAIRELAFFHLRRWVPQWQKVRYDPAGEPEARTGRVQAVERPYPGRQAAAEPDLEEGVRVLAVSRSEDRG